MKKTILTAAAFVLLAACSLTPKDTGNAFMFALPPAQTTHYSSVDDRLIVALPTMAPELDTFRIALVRKDGNWDYYAGARWSEFLPLLIQNGLSETLDNSGLFKTVTTDQSGLTGDMILKAEVGAFQADYTKDKKSPVVKIRLSVSIVSRQKRVPMATFNVYIEEKAAKDRLPEIQAAFAAAFIKTQKQLTQELTRTLTASRILP